MKKAVTKKPKSVDMDPSEVPEVQTFVDKSRELEQFVAQHAQVLDRLNELVEARNDALQEADMALRALSIDLGQGVNCGPFHFKHFTEKVNFEKMFITMEREDFERFGGAVRTAPSYTGDKATVLRAITSGEIPEDVAAEFYTKVPNYTKVEEYKLP